MPIAATLLIGVITLLISYALCAALRASKVKDAPDGVRKRQAVAVSRLGGVGIALSALIGASILPLWGYAFGQPQLPFAEWILSNWHVVAFTSTGLAIGLLDDLGWISTLPKLLGVLGAAVLITSSGLYPESFATPWGAIEALPFLVIGSTLWLLVFTNAANFMDGSNGLSMGCLAIMLLGLMIIGSQAGAFAINLWWVVLFAAVLGFLAHNLAGKLYAGDAGALGLGALFASLSLVSDLGVWTIATLALPFLVDVLLTLIWRAKHGRKWLQAHLDHAYQRLIDAGWSHLDAAVLYWGLTATAAAMAYIAALAGGFAPFAVFWVLLIAGSVIWVLHRRSAKRSEL
ncbi:MAG: hypothetical protein NXH72_00365 [Hyphomonadaceae bacterium]|nr:hypothetical protein [Hyphomonadaceae bacterium]